ncbi:hypothetical protein CO112_00235 [Candidatus Dojkabacteria bacterium CG_4_9_14_3_um_filter_150_Dojkabacteria_WS6_41_13]|uniref:Uncharacterized protein n=1 Tax=Candidatus Dojkabacteria bacterium CG_4_10_14_0_2_um_filter_Dojkabacteria_WS6_41_15 TaxID=2014249 RepID=A0A2M7W286_9BACT|nr:MAG: hypothetical protein COZ14_00180 [Candidatus Dojkabacteria bacterium CG_4_10_14_3_um_filter_Dojkabacteria_WS6_41_9]PJA14467.1 MAG: hypothetical protein COX64_01945 [Candidatus Dojkabacteria bacterium CG_4_10_14_0_2_um_filter_Dojkabacteria_WS6_41_15]PJB23920.1 MAG: hypothetical protein CO112_00235 [Candidatus Dojkabacteria bacterium CG_4_9_14_3_um_filter_150_Dojkabacteria_WS6_41_13]
MKIENNKLKIILILKQNLSIRVEAEIKTMKRQNIVALVLGSIFIFGLIVLWQYDTHQQLSKTDMSCGGDWSYNVRCPVGSYCQSLGQGPLAGGLCKPFLSPFFSMFKKPEFTNTKRQEEMNARPSVNTSRCSIGLSDIDIPEVFVKLVDKGYFVRFETGDYLVYRTQNNIEQKFKMIQNYLLTDNTKEIQKEDFKSDDIISIRLIETSINVIEAAIVTDYCTE